MNNNEENIKKFTKAIKKGLDYVHTHTSQEVATSLYGSFPSTDIKTIEKVVDRYKEIDAWTADLILSKEGFEKLQDVLQEANELTSRVDYDTLVTTKYL